MKQTVIKNVAAKVARVNARFHRALFSSRNHRVALIAYAKQTRFIMSLDSRILRIEKLVDFYAREATSKGVSALRAKRMAEFLNLQVTSLKELRML